MATEAENIYRGAVYALHEDKKRLDGFDIDKVEEGMGLNEEGIRTDFEIFSLVDRIVENDPEIGQSSVPEFAEILKSYPRVCTADGILRPRFFGLFVDWFGEKDAIAIKKLLERQSKRMAGDIYDGSDFAEVFANLPKDVGHKMEKYKDSPPEGFRLLVGISRFLKPLEKSVVHDKQAIHSLIKEIIERDSILSEEYGRYYCNKNRGMAWYCGPRLTKEIIILAMGKEVASAEWRSEQDIAKKYHKIAKTEYNKEIPFMTLRTWAKRFAQKAHQESPLTDDGETSSMKWLLNRNNKMNGRHYSSSLDDEIDRMMRIKIDKYKPYNIGTRPKRSV